MRGWRPRLRNRAGFAEQRQKWRANSGATCVHSGGLCPYLVWHGLFRDRCVGRTCSCRDLCALSAFPHHLFVRRNAPTAWLWSQERDAGRHEAAAAGEVERVALVPIGAVQKHGVHVRVQLQIGRRSPYRDHRLPRLLRSSRHERSTKPFVQTFAKIKLARTPPPSLVWMRPRSREPPNNEKAL